MTYDMVIRGGQIVDGTGSEPVLGDLAILDGSIAAVGKVDGKGKEEFDAIGQLVTPGFIDVHTHLDAQIGWDPYAIPVSWHGVTTVLMGNCGVTFAPVRPGDAPLLAKMMESVEDIPRDAILEGLPWDWEDYGSYLDSVDRTKPAVNIAGMVGHCAVRYYVMGERAVGEKASEEEKRQMADIVGKSIDAGAVGFSTNRLRGHTLPDGRCIPGTYADPDELLQIAKQVGPRDALMQNVLDFGDPKENNRKLLRDLAKTTGGRILFSFGAGPQDQDGRNSARFVESLCEGGLDITALSIPRGSGLHYGLQANLPSRNVFQRKQSLGVTWRDLARMDFDARLASINDTQFCARLVEEAKAYPFERIAYFIEASYWMGAGFKPDYTVGAEYSLMGIAREAGEHWSETFLRLSRETLGRGLFVWRMYNRNLEALGDFLKCDRVLPGLSDAGAHAQQVMDNGVTSFVLSYWVKQKGLYSMGEGIRRLTSAPARIIGLKDRGVLRPGMRADINVLDPDKVGEGYPEIVHDFPGGAARFIQRSTGYTATFVNGQLSVLEGKHTGTRAGGVLRHGQSTAPREA